MLVLSTLIIFGLVIFTGRYVNDGPKWVQHPSNKHYYRDGQPNTFATVFDRSGDPLLSTTYGAISFHENKAVRTALMHVTGDLKGNVNTSVQVAFGDKLTGWGLLNGAFKRYYESENKSLTLSLDAGLSAEAYKQLNGRKGAIGIYNYKTGEILVMTSSPSFDPQSPPNIDENPEKYEGVYINRFLSASYTPGSIFKLVTAAAAIENIDDIDNMNFHCDAEYLVDGNLVTCPRAHGELDFSGALAVSCNGAFAEIALELGGSTLQKYAEIAGFNSNLELDGMKIASSTVNTKNAKGADLAWAGIGQYSNLANPLGYMAFAGAIANDGEMVYPSILGESKHSKRILSIDTAQKLKSMMRNNVTSAYGEDKYKGLEMAAKSGTAEVGGDKAPHAWFVGFSEREDLPLAFVVIVENAGYGSQVAGPIAGKLLKAAEGKGPY